MLNYNEFFNNNIFDLEDIKYILKNIIKDDTLKYNSIANLIYYYDTDAGEYTIKESIKELIDDDFLIDKIGLFYYNEYDIKEILDKLTKYEEKTLIKFLSHLSEENFKKFLPKIDDKEIIKKVILNTKKTISFDAIKPELFRKLLLESDNDILNKIKSFDYSTDYDIKKIFSNKKIKEKFLSIIGEEKIKTFSNKSISTLLNDTKLKNLINDNLKQNLKKILVLRSFESNFEDFNMITKSISSEEFLEIFLEYTKSKTKEEINKIDLSDYKYSDEINKKITQEILKKSPKKLPKFNINLFSNEELYSLIKEEKIKSENI